MTKKHRAHVAAIKRLVAVLMGLLLSSLAFAAEKTSNLPDAAASDPAKLGWMVGSPPPPDRILRFADGSYWRFPAMRWSVCHLRQLMPTVNVSRGLGDPELLPRALRDDIDSVRFTPLGGKESMTWAESPGSQLHRRDRGVA